MQKRSGRSAIIADWLWRVSCSTCDVYLYVIRLTMLETRLESSKDFEACAGSRESFNWTGRKWNEPRSTDLRHPWLTVDLTAKACFRKMTAGSLWAIGGSPFSI